MKYSKTSIEEGRTFLAKLTSQPILIWFMITFQPIVKGIPGKNLSEKSKQVLAIAPSIASARELRSQAREDSTKHGGYCL